MIEWLATLDGGWALVLILVAVLSVIVWLFYESEKND